MFIQGGTFIPDYRVVITLRHMLSVTYKRRKKGYKYWSNKKSNIWWSIDNVYKLLVMEQQEEPTYTNFDQHQNLNSVKLQ